VLRGLDRALPTTIVFSCLNPNMGAGGHASVLAEVAQRRAAWSIPWLESDGSLWHLQFRAASIRDQVRAAQADQLSGVIAIHWRTEEILPNLDAFALAARDPAQVPPAEELYRRHCAARYGPASAGELAPLLLQLEHERQLGYVSSPEFYPYEPQWGRVSPALASRLRNAIELTERIRRDTPFPPHGANLDWLADNFRFTLLLDQVGRKLEPAYLLKEKTLRNEVDGADLHAQLEAAQQELASAPMEELFRTFARRVRSRGELGELSALNQKLWLQYVELDRWVSAQRR
jgi:hypothetical protein